MAKKLPETAWVRFSLRKPARAACLNLTLTTKKSPKGTVRDAWLMSWALQTTTVSYFNCSLNSEGFSVKTSYRFCSPPVSACSGFLLHKRQETDTIHNKGSKTASLAHLFPSWICVSGSCFVSNNQQTAYSEVYGIDLCSKIHACC